MKQKYTTHIFILFLMMTAWACTPTIDPPVPHAGTLDFSNFVAIGGSMTAGVSNRDVGIEGELPVGGLYPEGQMNSFPAIIARQINHIQTINFSQPTVEGNGSSYRKLEGFRSTCENFAPTPIISMTNEEPGWMSPSEPGIAYSNMGVPDLRIDDIENNNYQNPYLNRVVGDSTTYQEAILGTKPSFFTLWLGIEDFFQHAYLGGNGLPILSPEQYYERLNDILTPLLSDPNTRACVANIPDITQMPFFQSVKPLAHDLDCSAKDLWIETYNFEVVKAGENDMVLLTCFDNVLGQIGSGWGSDRNEPIPGKYVLDAYEVEQMQQKIDAINQQINTIVDEFNQDKKRIALVDMHTLFEQIYQGRMVNGIQVNSQYIYGSFFSLDGIFPTARGNALLANHFIRTINAAFPATNIPPANVTNYPGVRFP